MKDRVRGAIVGVAIGDALGMPAEGLKPETVGKYYGKISTYRTPRKRHFHNLKRGQWTDDTQLTLAIGESIIRMKGLDFEDIAQSHVDAFNGPRRGWGKTTQQGCQRLLMGDNWWEAGGDSGAGNGPPMKIAPVGILYGLDIISLVELIGACINISRMTHGDSRAAVAAVLQAYLIGEAMKKSSSGFFSSVLYNIHLFADRIEDISDDVKNSLTERLYLGTRSLGAEPEQIRKLTGAGAFVNESLPFTYAILLKYQDNIETCIETLVNMGGDSDTNASMAAAILGAVYGYKAFPKKWRRGLEDRKRLVNLADGLYNMA
jgi:ADP-ribosylglycohydrolase